VKLKRTKQHTGDSIARMPDGGQDVIRAWVHGESIQHISRRLGVSRNTVTGFLLTHAPEQALKVVSANRLRNLAALAPERLLEQLSRMAPEDVIKTAKLAIEACGRLDGLATQVVEHRRSGPTQDEVAAFIAALPSANPSAGQLTSPSSPAADSLSAVSPTQVPEPQHPAQRGDICGDSSLALEPLGPTPALAGQLTTSPSPAQATRDRASATDRGGAGVGSAGGDCDDNGSPPAKFLVDGGDE
jgi:uncharacterized protein (DUF1778 family)